MSKSAIYTAADISLIIPCANMAHFLDDALLSVVKQSALPGEVAIVHPPEDSRTIDVARTWTDRLPVRLVAHPLSGPGPARNAGVAQTKCPVISFLDADDLMAETRFSVQLARLNAAPAVDAVGGFLETFADADKKCGGLPELTADGGGTCSASVNTWLFKRALFDQLGGFDPAFLYAEDVDFLLRMRDENLPHTILDQTVLFYRQHRQSMMHQKNPRLKSDFSRAVMGSAMRRRRAGLPPADTQFLTEKIEPSSSLERGTRRRDTLGRGTE